MPFRGRIQIAEKGLYVHQPENNASSAEMSSLYSQRQQALHYPPYNDFHHLPHLYLPYLGSSALAPSHSLSSYSGSHPSHLPSYNNAGQGPAPPFSHYYAPYPVEPLELIHDPQPCDGKRNETVLYDHSCCSNSFVSYAFVVLSGRGGATNSHSGNRAFRTLVKKYQTQYLKAKKRDKPAVAAVVVEKIRATGGRFLRRHHVTSNGVVWVEIGDEKAREKTCQALRGTAEYFTVELIFGTVHDCFMCLTLPFRNYRRSPRNSTSQICLIGWPQGS
jgi:hypothetical protein